MYDVRWFKREFVPLVKKAQKAGIDPRAQGRFIQWIKDSKDDNVNFMWGTIRHFMSECGSETYNEFCEDALAY